jgi:hypothetical protein
MQQEKVTVSARITKEMYTFCLQEYTNMSVAINAGLELLKENSLQNHLQKEENHLQNVNNCKRDEEQLHEKDAEIKELQENIIKNVETSKEIKELNEKIVNNLTERLENNELTNNLIITEKNNLIDTLKNELADNKQMHNNYFLQMQTLINQKLIEAPGSKKWFEFWKR